VTVEAFAKVNLTLEVFGKRPDGFHALRSVVLPIRLSDTLTFTPADAFSTDTGYPDDLILQVPKALAKEVEKRRGRDEQRKVENSSVQPSAFNLQPYRIHVEKRIPAGGGLGGGSADAAATLLALNELWKLDKSPEELAEIGAQVGSDVPALVLANRYRAPVLMEGRGEIVSLLNPQSATLNLSLVLANPGVPSSTAAVYGKCVSRDDDGGAALGKMRTALEARDIGCIATAMMNDLQEPAVALCPAIGETLAALRKAGALGAMMSGSGSTVFGLVPTEDDGRKIAALLNGRGIRAWSVAAC